VLDDMVLLLVAALAASVATVSPSAGARHDRFVAEAHAVDPASGCVNNRDRVFADRRAGVRIRAVLDPARGEGGPEGWCRGRFRGTVTYTEAFACPAAGRCRPPRGFPTRTVLVARFSFRVR
jgi:hypothetical protein